MDVKIGKTFIHNGKVFQVVKSTQKSNCPDCAFEDKKECPYSKDSINIFQCAQDSRADGLEVHFEEV